MRERTTTTLLEHLHDPANQVVWEEFDARYRPVLFGVGVKLGLGAADAADAAQEALTRFVQAYRSGRYERTRGSLRGWLIGIARHCVRDVQAERAGRREERGISAVAELPDEARVTRFWEEQQRRVVLEKALEALRASPRLDARTLRAFEMIALERRAPAETAAHLGVTLNDVYLAKHRCMKRMRTLVRRLEEAYRLE